MKIARFEIDGVARWGILTEPTRIKPLGSRYSGERMLDLCRTDELLNEVESRDLDVSRLKWLPPVPYGGKIICIGKNFADHAKEMGGDAPELPVVFSKFSSVLIGHRASIVLPPISKQVDYEAELVVVIGRSARNISQSSAFEHVAGYTCGNDVTARDWQKGRPGGQWLLGKTFDTFGPLGPCLVTPDEVGDPHQLDITLRLNGQIMQQANTNLLIYPIDYLIAHISQFVTLMPGDLLFTGTPAGVGAGRNPPVFLKAGDELEVEISKIGKLRNSVISL